MLGFFLKWWQSPPCRRLRQYSVCCCCCIGNIAAWNIQSAAISLGLGTSKSVLVLFKRRISVFLQPSSKPEWFFIKWRGLIFPVSYLRAGVSKNELELLSPSEGSLSLWCFLLFWGWVPPRMVLLPFHQNPCCSFFITFTVEDLFCQSEGLLPKTLTKVGIEGTYLNIIKVIYDKPIANVILNGEKLKALPIKSGKWQGCLLSTLLFNIQHNTVSPSHSNQSNKRNKRYPDWKRWGKTVILCRWHNTIHRKSKDYTWKLLWLINKLSKIEGYKTNIQKSVAFLYTNSEVLEKEYKNIILFRITPLKIKYLVIKLTKEVKDLYAKNYETLRKFKRIQRNGKIFHVPGLEELISLKWSYYWKQYTYIMQFLSNYPWHFSQN